MGDFTEAEAQRTPEAVAPQEGARWAEITTGLGIGAEAVRDPFGRAGTAMAPVAGIR
ncbi:hypothetical protein ACIP2X_09360 [Streptomyces sp. NPDC089424]|uniref:hypothetical protein n=1 Tax=Streptomyces sp. NPDC089424 TaxID=3365917 RepID=UPI0038095132